MDRTDLREHRSDSPSIGGSTRTDRRQSRPRLVAALLGVAFAAAALPVPDVNAIDPPPAYIEQASEAVQAQYVEKVGRQGIAEKRAVGRERHDRKLSERRKLFEAMNADRSQRRIAHGLVQASPAPSRRPIESDSPALSEPDPNQVRDRNVTIAMLIIALSLVIGLYRMHTRQDPAIG